MNTRPGVGILHPGEMGTYVAASAAVAGCDVAWVSEGRSPASRSRAAEQGLRDVETLRNLVGHSEIIISVCPPHAAESVFQNVIQLGFRGTYVEANAIAPARVVVMGETATAHGIRFVDGGIVGQPAWKAGATCLHLSGEGAGDVAASLEGGPLATNVLGDTIGSASALKMCFAANTKGTTAMFAAILGTAERLGVRRALEAQWEAFHPGLAKQATDRLRSVARKAWRFAGEMEEISRTFRDAGMPGEFHQGAHEIYRRLSGYKDVQDPPELDAVVARLLETRDPASGVADSKGEVRIVPARRSDTETLLELIRGLADYERMSDAVTATAADLERTLFGSDRAAEALLAWSGDQPVGMAIFFRNYSTFLASAGFHLEDLFVVPEWRGRGIGRRLLAAVAAIAHDRGYPRLEWAVLDWNESAIDFYRRRGANLLSEWRLCRVSGDALAQLAGANGTASGETEP